MAQDPYNSLASLPQVRLEDFAPRTPDRIASNQKARELRKASERAASQLVDVPIEQHYEATSKREERIVSPADVAGELVLVYEAPNPPVPDEFETPPHLSQYGVAIPEFTLSGDEAERAVALLEVLITKVPNARDLLSRVVTRHQPTPAGGPVYPTAARLPVWSSLIRFLALVGADALATRVSKANGQQLETLVAQLAASAEEPGPSEAWKAEQARKHAEEQRQLEEARVDRERESAEARLRAEAVAAIEAERQAERDRLVAERVERLRVRP